MSNPLTPTELAVQLDAERQRKGISKPELASAVGVSDRTMRGWLDGADLTITKVISICDALGVSLGAIVARSEQAAKVAA